MTNIDNPQTREDVRETLEQFAIRVVAATRKIMLDGLSDDVIGRLGDSHLVFGKACAMAAIATAKSEAARHSALSTDALREALLTKRDYVSDVANGHTFYPNQGDVAAIRLQAVQDLLNINAALSKKAPLSMEGLEK